MEEIKILNLSTMLKSSRLNITKNQIKYLTIQDYFMLHMHVEK
jgi:hypothetical protein